MNKKSRAGHIVELLEQEYPDAVCSLVYEKPHELLIATRLSAQCTDARVNIVTQTLYAKYKSLEDFAAADTAEVEEIVRPCGFGPTKARDIVAMSKMLLSEYGGVVPDTVDELLKLPGVGRKTANLVVGDIYHKPAVVCDTHCIRITNLLGLCDSKNPEKVERQLRDILDPEKSNDFCHRMVLHGRVVCVARSPGCGKCCLSEYCGYFAARSGKVYFTEDKRSEAITLVTSCSAIKWAELCNELWPHNSAEEMLEAFNRGEFKNEFLYQKDGMFVALLSLSLRSDYVEGTDSSPVGYIEGIYVKPEYRNKGIARELTSFAKQWALNSGCSMLASDCELSNEGSRLFHNKTGFTEANINVHFTMKLS